MGSKLFKFTTVSQDISDPVARPQDTQLIAQLDPDNNMDFSLLGEDGKRQSVQIVSSEIDLSALVRKDGTVPLTADWNVGGFKIKGLGAPTLATDAATKSYVDSSIAAIDYTPFLRRDGTLAMTGQLDMGANNIKMTAGQAIYWGTTNNRIDGYALGVRLYAAGNVQLDVTNLGATFTPPVFVPDGTNAAPSISFSGDPDSGFYRIGSDQVGFTLGGVKIGDLAYNPATSRNDWRIYQGAVYAKMGIDDSDSGNGSAYFIGRNIVTVIGAQGSGILYFMSGGFGASWLMQGYALMPNGNLVADLGRGDLVMRTIYASRMTGTGSTFSAIDFREDAPATGAVNLTHSTPTTWTAQNRTGGPFTTLVTRRAQFQAEAISDGVTNFVLKVDTSGGALTEIARFASASLSFFGATPAVQQTITALTDNSGGTPSDTIAAAGVLYGQANENDFRASVATKINELRSKIGVAYGLVA